MRRTITGRSGARTMSLGDLRQFLASIDGIPDDAVVKARATWGRKLRSVTVEEEDVGFRDYLRAVGVDPGSIDVAPGPPPSAEDPDPEVAFGTGVGLTAGMPSTSAGGSRSRGGSSSGSGTTPAKRTSKSKASSV